MSTVISNAAAVSNVTFRMLVVTDMHTMKAGTSDPVAGAGNFAQVRMATALTEVLKYGPYTNYLNIGDTIHGAAVSGTLAEQLVPYATFRTGLLAAYPSIVETVVIGNHDNITGTNNKAQFAAACPGFSTYDGNVLLSADTMLIWMDSQGKNGDGTSTYALSSAQQTYLTNLCAANTDKKLIIAMHVPFGLTSAISRYYIYGSHTNPTGNLSAATDLMTDADYFYSLMAANPNIQAFFCGHWHLTSNEISDPTCFQRQVIFPAVSGRNNIPPPSNTWYGQRGGFGVVTGYTNGSLNIEFKYFD